MLTPEQAKELRTAGLSAYNHNLDTSPEFYGKITSSRKYEVGAGFNRQLEAASSNCHSLLWQFDIQPQV